MFEKLGNAIKELNANVADVATCEKAKKLRKNLLVWGGIGVALGALMILGGIVLFMSSFASFGEFTGLPVTTIIGMVMFAMGGGVLSISAILIHYGLTILIGGEAVKLVDKSINQRCECGEVIQVSSKFCPKCGKAVRKTCECGHVNDPAAEFCSECGKKLK